MSWQTLSKEKLDENPFWEHWKNRFRTGAGREGDYHYHVNNNAVAGFARLDDGRFVMIREYRYLFDKISVSHVQGGKEPGEEPEQTFRRELEEEIGYRAGRVTHLSRTATAPAFSKEEVDVYLAEDLKHVGEKPEGVEEIEVITMTAQQIDDAIRHGDIWDDNVMADWLLVKLYLDGCSNV